MMRLGNCIQYVALHCVLDYITPEECEQKYFEKRIRETLKLFVVRLFYCHSLGVQSRFSGKSRAVKSR